MSGWLALVCLVVGLMRGVDSSAFGRHDTHHGMAHGMAGGGGKGVPPSLEESSTCVVADFEVQANFNIHQYVGTWYTISTTRNMSSSFHRRSHYSLGENGGLAMTTRRIPSGNGCDTGMQFEADAHIPEGAASQSKLLVQPRGFDVPPEDYWVVYTDYVDHALVYSCSHLDADGTCTTGHDHVWFLGRAGMLSVSARHHMMSLLPGLCVDAESLTDVSTDCDEQLGVPQVHEEMSSPVCAVSGFQPMTNFNASQYVGTWYVVAHLQDEVYPYHRVSHYTLTDEGSLRMITHRITSASECSAAWKFEGEAYIPDASELDSKMVLKPFGMPVYGEDYWVIYTDYTDHALVYSCREMNEDGSCIEGGIHAWLMSRNPTLTSMARSHIEMILTEMCVDIGRLLDTPHECDEILGPDSLINQGPSNECVVQSFETMQGFDKEQYAGTWYVISHIQENVYPYQRVSNYTVEEDGSITMATDRITGPDSCSSAWHFEASATLPEASLSSSRMLLKPRGMDVEGEDYWVVYTDYTDHALVYSCGAKNLDGTCQEGAVRAWLMGRRPHLSDVARSHMISILREMCVNPWLLIDLPSECDEDLGVSRVDRCNVEKFSVMEDFDTLKYMGSWYVVSSLQDGVYPYHRLSHYSLESDGSITMATDRISDGPDKCSSPRHFEAKATLGKDSRTRSKFILKPVGIPAPGEDYWVVYANYTDHALVYTCSRRSLDGTCEEGATHAHMLSRRPTLSDGARQHLEMLLERLCIDPADMTLLPTECDSSLEAGVRRPVVELGVKSCVVEELPVMEDFDINLYAGVWYTVSQIQPFEYPFHRVSNYTLQENGRLLMSTDQFIRAGECTTMHFDAEAFHEEEEEDVTRGGKLILQPLDSRVPPGNYWVVYTDYHDHALVYSCIGLNKDGSCKRGRSMAWFMSRNPTLSEAAMGHMKYLLRQMCVKTSRLRDVITDCDESIGIFGEPAQSACAINDFKVKQDFVIEKYLGDWYELSHTQDESHMTVPDNEMLTISTAPSGSGADISITMKNIRLNDVCNNKNMPGLGWLRESEPAKLIVSFPLIPDGFQVPDVVNHWILDTDYDNYAITYTCHRTHRDGSCAPSAQGLWILGRSRQIQPAFWTTVQGVIDRACVDQSVIRPNPAPCTFETPHVEPEPSDLRSCADTEFGCCLLSEDAALDADYSNCPRVPPPVAGRVVPEPLVSMVEGEMLCDRRINCKMFCRFGFKRNSDKCEICECAEEPIFEGHTHRAHEGVGGACETRYDTIMAKLKNNSPRNGFYIPQCDEYGNYSLLQCLYPRDACWCADALTGDRLRKATYNGDTPSCDP